MILYRSRLAVHPSNQNHEKNLKLSPEDSLTIAVANYLRMQYPRVVFCHIANERQTTPQRGAKLKKMGVRAGMPDIMIFSTRHLKGSSICKGFQVYSGLAIELKVGKNKPTKEQERTLDQLRNECWVTDVCYSFDEAKLIIDKYLN